MKCRYCEAPLIYTFLDLGFAPPSNSYLTNADLLKPEKYYPLKTKVCNHCWLVQTEDYAEASELFDSEYAYFSSMSSSYLAHAKRYAEKIITEVGLDSKNMVVEVASNDGYLLKNFIAAGIPCLGIEPTKSTANVAEKLGIPVIRKFFGETLGKELVVNDQQADLIVANNVYAHVPDIKDFTLGLKVALKQGGTITLEFPHLVQLIEKTQFDTVYHEHFSYLSLQVVCKIFIAAGLRVWKVEELPVHGGSLRVYGCHLADKRPTDGSVIRLLEQEAQHGLEDIKTYTSFQARADKIKNDLLSFLVEQKRAGKKVCAYGAAAKGSTLLNYAGVKPDLIEFVCDAAPAKQGKFMPGSHIPILQPIEMFNRDLDYVLILPWNILSEVIEQNSALNAKGIRFVTAVPELTII